MKLPCSLIVSKIKENFNISIDQDLKRDFLLQRPMMCKDEKILLRGQIYIFLDTTCVVEIKMEQDCLIIRGKENIWEIIDYIHELFTLYEDWYLQINEACLNNEPLDAILSISEKVFENPITFMNSIFQIIGTSREFDEHNKIMMIDENNKNENLNSRFLPLDMINDFKNNREYQKVQSERDVFIYSEGILNFRTLCINVFEKDTFAGRIVITEYNSQFKDWQKYLLKKLEPVVKKSYLRDSVDFSKKEKIANFFQQILEGQAYSEVTLENILFEKRWKREDIYVCADIRISSEDRYLNTLTFFYGEITAKYKECVVLINDNYIVILVNLGNYNNMLSEFMKSFIEFLRDSNFRAGLSNTFIGPENLGKYYKQAATALQYGIANNPTRWTHNFSTYAVDYILDKAGKESEPELLVANEIKILMENDKKHNTDFYHTLKVYLKNNQNAVQTAKQLFIHRATLIHRIERIVELTAIDFKNMDKVMYLMLSFKIMEHDTNML